MPVLASALQEPAPPDEAAPGPVRSDATTRKRPAPAPHLPPSGAEDPTFAVAPEAPTAPTEAAMVSDRASDTVQVLRQMRGRGRTLWPVWAVLAIVAVAGLLAVVLQTGSGPQSAPSAVPAAPGSADMPPPAAPPEPTALPSVPPSATLPSAATTTSAAPKGTPTSRDNGGIIRVNPFGATPQPTEAPAASSAARAAPTNPRTRPVMP